MAKKVEYSVEERLRALYDLQLVDSRIDKLRSVRGELPLEVKDLEDENVIFINESEKELNLDNILYEMIVLAFPTKRQHKLNSVKNDECNKEMVNLINKYSIKEKKDIDPRWEALKKLK